MFNSRFEINVPSRHDYYNLTIKSTTEVVMCNMEVEVSCGPSYNVLSGLVKFWLKQR